MHCQLSLTTVSCQEWAPATPPADPPIPAPDPLTGACLSQWTPDPLTGVCLSHPILLHGSHTSHPFSLMAVSPLLLNSSRNFIPPNGSCNFKLPNGSRLSHLPVGTSFHVMAVATLYNLMAVATSYCPGPSGSSCAAAQSCARRGAAREHHSEIYNDQFDTFRANRKNTWRCGSCLPSAQRRSHQAICFSVAQKNISLGARRR